MYASRSILSYLPGFVFLAVSMFALYSVVDLVEVYKARPVSAFRIKYAEDRLYWVVIALGLAGFVLTIVHAFQFTELRAMHLEKKQALSDFQVRLAALEMAKDGILILDKKYNISFINQALFEVLGFGSQPKEGFLGQNWSVLFSDDAFDILNEDIMPDLDSHGFWIGEFPIYRDDGSVVYTDMSLTRVTDIGLIATLQDVTYRQHAEQEKKELQDQFYQAQKMEAIGRLAGGIAHDFNNILASMNGYAEFLIDDLDDETEQHGFAKNILQAGLQARSLVDKMLAFSRKDIEEFDRINIVSIVDETLSMLDATLSKSIELDHGCSVLNAYLQGNSTQISQLLMNLCVNAQDAMEDGNGRLGVHVDIVQSAEAPGVRIQAGLPSTEDFPPVSITDSGEHCTTLVLGHLAEDQSYVKISVQDTGGGIPRTVMEHIFEPFFTTKSVDKGTGLGLATSHGVIVSHQACMVVNSTVMKGTVFDLYFPLLDYDVIETPQLDDVVVDFDVARRKKRRILLVEDQEDVRVMMLKMINRIGYDAICAVSGKDGLDVVRDDLGKYDLIITDQNMPEMTGLEMIECLHREFPELPFIMLSGYSEAKIQEIVNEHPAIKSVLKKPVSKQVLAEHIDDILSVAA